MENQFQEYYPFSKEPEVLEAFQAHLRTYETSHISAEKREDLIRWLTDKVAKSKDQSHYSSRNWITTAYKWDSRRKLLLVGGTNEETIKGKKKIKRGKGGKNARVGRRSEYQDRIIVTEDEILDIVEKIHMSNGHKGWDATWNEVSRKYVGIMRADVIFLLRRCYICSLNPRKNPRRPVGSTQVPASSSSLPGPSSEQQAYQEQQFWLAAEQQYFDQSLDQFCQLPFDYGFGIDNYQYGSYEGLGLLFNEEVPNVGMTDMTDMTNMTDMSNMIDMTDMFNMANTTDLYPFLFDTGLDDLTMFTYPHPEEDLDGYNCFDNFDYMQDS